MHGSRNPFLLLAIGGLTSSLIVGLISAGLPAWAQAGSSADALADEIALTELGLEKPRATPKPTTKQAPPAAVTAEPERVSILDVAAKLALLVLAVYGLAWGARCVQRNGFRLPLAPSTGDSLYLRRRATLPLRDGASLHVVEVDRRSLVIATGRCGDVTLLLDLSAPQEPPTLTPVQTSSSQESEETESAGRELDTPLVLQDEADWEQRRDALIRALMQRA